MRNDGSHKETETPSPKNNLTIILIIYQRNNEKQQAKKEFETILLIDKIEIIDRQIGHIAPSIVHAKYFSLNNTNFLL